MDALLTLILLFAVIAYTLGRFGPDEPWEPVRMSPCPPPHLDPPRPFRRFESGGKRWRLDRPQTQRRHPQN